LEYDTNPVSLELSLVPHGDYCLQIQIE